MAQSWKGNQGIDAISDGLKVRSCSPVDAVDMARLYSDVFQTYPFPIFDPHYLIQSMSTHVRYYCISEADQIVALSAAEMDHDNRCVEMTDFATQPEHRGQGLANRLMEEMEKVMKIKGMKTAFSIARALSPGMNITFGKRGYAYGGTLGNNTNIAGRIESMNVWYKRL